MRIRYNRFSTERTFRSYADFARFARKQAEKFAALEDESPLDFKSWAKTFMENWLHAASLADGERDDLQTKIERRPLLLFDSALVQHASLMTEQNRQSWVGEIIPFLTGDRDRFNAGQLSVPSLSAHGEIAAILSLESKLNRKNVPGSVDNVVRHHEERLEELLETDLEELLQKRSDFESFINKAGERFKSLNGQVVSAIAQREAQWEETHNSFIEQLKTETAVDLWAKRAETHTTRYESRQKWSVGYGLIGLMLTIIWIFAGYGLARYLFPSDTAAQIASYTAGSVAIFTLFVWGLRVLVRSMISEDHLATDASARSALAHTYLALIKDSAATQDDRAIILASLFAPVSDGLVKDDGMPALSPTAMAAQVLSRP